MNEKLVSLFSTVITFQIDNFCLSIVSFLVLKMKFRGNSHFYKNDVNIALVYEKIKSCRIDTSITYLPTQHLKNSCTIAVTDNIWFKYSFLAELLLIFFVELSALNFALISKRLLKLEVQKFCK